MSGKQDFVLGLDLHIHIVLMTGCILWNRYPSGPIKWTFVVETVHEASSRKWTVSFAPVKQKQPQYSWIIQVLRIVVVLVEDATIILIFHLDGPWAPPSDNVLEFLAGSST